MAIKVVDAYTAEGWRTPASATEQAREYCAQLEAGDILFFSECPFSFPQTYRDALLAHKQSGLRFHKNISYQPATGKIRGLAEESIEGETDLREIMRCYSSAVQTFVDDFLRPYAGNYLLDYASYRPVEEAGRKMTLHKRNDLLHVDAFPNRPTRGDRILRVFMNLNPTESRDWITTDGFGALAAEHARKAGLEKIARRGESLLWKMLYQAAWLPKQVFGGVKSSPTTYDRFMHHFHNYLKENSEYQEACPKQAFSFPPGASWMVYTDYVPHAVLRGRFALEQTFIIHREAMVQPEHAPLHILEQICGKRLAA